ncbi:DNA-binding protein [Candidatus Woesearchaeota archaeon]|nr:DNA-binding protein [Candidatus Woesearchaeota archaeon]
MKSKKLNDGNYVANLEKGDNIVESLLNFCSENNIKLGFFNGLGALDKVELAHFNAETKKYSSIVMEDALEIISLHGNITEMNNKIYIHPHIVVSDDKMKAFGGHLKEGRISTIGEIFVVPMKGKVARYHSEEIGLNVLDL